jgi:formyltetrahydrofolate deformylase
MKLLISCPDQKGIVYEISKFISENQGNIIDSQQHSLGLNSHFFMRLEIDEAGFKLKANEFEKAFEAIKTKFQMETKC